jgi:phosphosulfolactate synthase (CoM biosynthesis protein A)
MIASPDILAFERALPIVDPGAKPRGKVGLTEIRDRALGLAEAENMARTVGAYVDTAKYTCGTQRLFTRGFVKAKNEIYAAHGIDVSSGGMLERVVQYGEAAVHAFLEESRELGFTVIEISTGLTILSERAKSALIKTALGYGFKVKPEVAMTYGTGVRGDEQVRVSADRIIGECVACLEAGATMIMIEEEGIFQYVKEPQTDLVHRLVRSVGLENLMFEAGEIKTMNWLIKSYGPRVNLFVDPLHVFFLASLRAGIWGLSDTLGRVADFDPDRRPEARLAAA